MIVFLSDNGWLQGEHRITGDKFLPYEESLRVPLIIRGPGVPKGQTVDGQVSNIDFAPTLLDVAEREGRAGRWTASRCCRRSRDPKQPPEPGARDRGAARRCSRATSRSTPGTGPTRAFAPTATPTSSGPRPARRSSTTATADPYQLDNVAGDPAYAAIEARPGGEAGEARRLQGRGVQREAVSGSERGRLPHARRALRRACPDFTSSPATARSTACGSRTSTRATGRRSSSSTASRPGRTCGAR